MESYASPFDILHDHIPIKKNCTPLHMHGDPTLNLLKIMALIAWKGIPWSNIFIKLRNNTCAFPNELDCFDFNKV